MAINTSYHVAATGATDVTSATGITLHLTAIPLRYIAAGELGRSSKHVYPEQLRCVIQVLPILVPRIVNKFHDQINTVSNYDCIHYLSDLRPNRPIDSFSCFLR
nr:hypothetical protein [Desulfobulbaceae bacterium]